MTKKNQFIYLDINGLHFLHTRLRGVITTGEDVWKFANNEDREKVKQKLAWLIFNAIVHEGCDFDIKIRKKIGMNYLDEFDEKNIEKFRLMSLKENDNQDKREYYYSFLFGRYNDTFNKRLFFS